MCKASGTGRLFKGKLFRILGKTTPVHFNEIGFLSLSSICRCFPFAEEAVGVTHTISGLDGKGVFKEKDFPRIRQG